MFVLIASQGYVCGGVANCSCQFAHRVCLRRHHLVVETAGYFRRKLSNDAVKVGIVATPASSDSSFGSLSDATVRPAVSCPGNASSSALCRSRA